VVDFSDDNGATWKLLRLCDDQGRQYFNRAMKVLNGPLIRSGSTHRSACDGQSMW
jgi:hypothetical protein